MSSRGLRLGLAVLGLVLLTSGCSTPAHLQATEGPPVNTSWPLDSLNYVYTDPVAVSPVTDHPLRWLGFVMHPIGITLDYAVNRQAYSFAATQPGFFGFTSEDTTLHSQRQSLATNY